ncbi:MAG: hypothetical protein ACT4PO_10055 [Actinomycetota bacterium]
MRSRPFVFFWGAAVAAVFLLGSLSATFARVRSAAGIPVDWFVLVLAGIGLATALLVAGRIVWVVGRLQKQARRAAERDASAPVQPAGTDGFGG